MLHKLCCITYTLNVYQGQSRHKKYRFYLRFNEEKSVQALKAVTTTSDYMVSCLQETQ